MKMMNRQDTKIYERLKAGDFEREIFYFLPLMHEDTKRFLNHENQFKINLMNLRGCCYRTLRAFVSSWSK
ncbi:MAG TPA: hypothetical protein DIW81_01040 [Planctomycetaceae bacterium]|nr:hypothetical protein [Rubinisphaera sp.]HCS50169.1 hypothetical protein [Planctomycetaceae bacterium]